VNCPVCGTHNPITNRFCGNCGAALESACTNCGSTNPASMRFCGQCGVQLGVGPPAAETPISERRLITVLFADLAGYTPFSEGRDPEDVRAFLTSYFDRAQEIVDRFGGTIDKFIGDAVMAVWGAIRANEDDAERAVRAGLELVDAAAKLAADAGAPELGLRLGIHTGEASVGPGGNQMGLVAGDNVNIASRLQSMAAPGTVLVGEGTYLSSSRSIVFEPVGEQIVKGKAAPVSAWRAMRVVAERGGVGRTEQLEPPYVGRGEELRLLKDLLASVGRDSRSRLVSLMGEGGIGKSRLIWEFRKYIDGLVETIYWHEGRSPAYGDGVTFWAVAEMIRRRADIAETDSNEVAEAGLTTAIEKYLPEQSDQEWVVPRLRAVLGLGEAPAGDRAELDASVRLFFEGVSAAGTTVLVFEDLHWADSGLLDFVEELTEWWRDRPILIVALARPDLTDRRPNWGAGKQGMISLRLGPLTNNEMRALVGGTVRGLPDEAVTGIVDRAAGIPLYAVELLRMLLAQGDLEEADGHYRLVGDLVGLAVPESLQAVIGARLDRLDPEDRTLLQDAAVLGYAFTADGLASINPPIQSDLESRLARLARKELIEPVRDPRSPERGQYRFLQTMIRDVALGRMSRDTKRARHLQVAEYFEQLLDPELAVVVASHYLDALNVTPPGQAAGVRSKAMASMSAAAARAADLRAHEQVLTISGQALTLADSPGLKAPFWERMTEAATSLARRDESERYGRLALNHYRDVGDEPGEHRMIRILGFAYLEEQQPTVAVQLLESHLVGRDLVSDPELAKAGALLARALLLSDRDDEAVGAADRASAAAEKLDLKATVVDALITKATALGHAGRLVEARILLEGAVELADENDITHASMRGRNNISHLFGPTDPLRASQANVEAYELAKKTGNRSFALLLGMNLAGWYVFTLELEQIDKLLSEPILQKAPDPRLSGFLTSQAAATSMRGDFDAAIEMHSRAFDLGEGEADPQLLMRRQAELSQIALLRGDLVGAFDSSIELCHEGWIGVLNGLGPAISALSLLGDRNRIPALLDVTAPYTNLIPRWPDFWQMVLDTDPGAPLPRTEVEQAIMGFDENLLRQWALQSEIAAARFSPRGHPDREDYLAQARARCEHYGLKGVLRQIDQYVA
jgi:class 3 adenylate cyclase/tetratricopeptide (TPR) repeat protein